jgi:hypothetical protein
MPATGSLIKHYVRLAEDRAAQALNVVRSQGRLRLAIALLLLLAAFWEGHRVLPVRDVPDRSPATMVALLPAMLDHSAKTGYVTALQLNVTDCHHDVSGTAWVAVPSEWDNAEINALADAGDNGFWRLVAVAFNDPKVRIFDMRYEEGIRYPIVSPRAFWRHPWKALIPHAGGSGQIALLRPGEGLTDEGTVQVSFTAPWIFPRSYASCWLAVPELVSPLHDSTFAEDVSDDINYRLTVGSGLRAQLHATPVLDYPDAVGVKGPPPPWASSATWVRAATDPAVGTVVIRSPLHVDWGASQAPPSSPGAPGWSCDARGAGFLTLGANQFAGGPLYNPYGSVLSLSNYHGIGPNHSCAAWVALATADAAGNRDTWLLIIGALGSLGAALLVDAVLGGRGENAGSGESPRSEEHCPRQGAIDNPAGADDRPRTAEAERPNPGLRDS